METDEYIAVPQHSGSKAIDDPFERYVNYVMNVTVSNQLYGRKKKRCFNCDDCLYCLNALVQQCWVGLLM